MRLILSVVALLVCGGLCLGDDCRRARTVYQTYAAPAYQYTPAYTPAYQQNYNQVVLVPKVIEVASYADHSYSIDSYYQQSLLADAIVGRLLRMQQIALVSGKPVEPSVQPSVQPMPLAQRQMPQADLDVKRPSSYQSAELVQVVQQSCIKCHTGAAPRLPLLTTDGKLLDLPRSQCLDLYYRVNTGTMPKAAAPVDDKFMPLLAKWVEASK